MSERPEPPAPSIVFRTSPLTVLAALALAVCATPFAFGAPLLWLIYLVPLAIIVWTLRVRTVVDAEAVTVRRVLRRPARTVVADQRAAPG